MDGSDEPGRKTRPKGGYIRGMFSGVQSADDFAAKLGVPIKSIALVRPKATYC